MGEGLGRSAEEDEAERNALREQKVKEKADELLEREEERERQRRKKAEGSESEIERLDKAEARDRGKAEGRL